MVSIISYVAQFDGKFDRALKNKKVLSLKNDLPGVNIFGYLNPVMSQCWEQYQTVLRV
jgi:hypothetical protein